MIENPNAGKRGGVKLPTNDAVYIPHIASMLVLGKSTAEISQSLGIGFNTAKRIIAKEETKALVKEITSGIKETARATTVKKVAELTDLAIEGLKKALREGNVQAIRTHFQVIGAIGDESADVKRVDGGNLTVVLPGAKLEQQSVIEVKDGGEEIGEVVGVGSGGAEGSDLP